MGIIIQNKKIYSGSSFNGSQIEPEVIQTTAIPIPNATLVGKVYQYIGDTNVTYTNGFFYKCMTDGTSFEWVNIPTQDSYSKSQIGNLNDLPYTTKNVIQNISTINEFTDDLSEAVGTKEPIFRFSILPEPSEELLNVVYQYIGETNDNYIKGYWYQCVAKQAIIEPEPSEEEPEENEEEQTEQEPQIITVYEWINVKIQPRYEKVRTGPNTYCVDSDNGDDETGDGSLLKPYRTIQKAINQLGAIGWRKHDKPSWSMFDVIRVNCGATNPYEPCYFEKTSPVTIASYDPSQSYIDEETGKVFLFNDSLTSTLKIVSNPYLHPDYTEEEYYVNPSAWYQRESIVYIQVKNVNITQNAINTAVYIGHASTLDHGDGNYANPNILGIVYTFIVNATTARTYKSTRINSTTGKTELYNYPTQGGCEGIGIHDRSAAYFRGYASTGSRVTVNASNWAIAASGCSRINIQGLITLNGGSNVSGGNYGAIYAATNSVIILDGSGLDASHLGTCTITSSGKSSAISCSDGATIRFSNGYVKWTIQQTRSDCVQNCIECNNGSMLSLSSSNAAYMNIVGKTKTYRVIHVGSNAQMIIGFPSSGTANVTGQTDSSSQTICVDGGGMLSLWGGSGTTLPVITGKVGYQAVSGGVISYVNIGKFTGTTQRSTGSGGRIYTGGQSSVGAY